MEWKSIKIELFNENLILHARRTKDVLNFNSFVKSLPVKVDLDTKVYINYTILTDALYLNLQLFPHFLKYLRLKWKFRRSYVYKHLAYSQLTELCDKVLTELDGIKQDEGKVDISNDIMLRMVSTQDKISIHDAENLPINEFLKSLTQAFNYANFLRGGKLELLTSEDKQVSLEREYEDLFGDEDGQ